MGYQQKYKRRDFLRAMGITVAAGGVASFVPQMRMLSTAAAAQKGAGDYKALVCLELNAGNDSYNLLMPRDAVGSGSHYDTYRMSRGGVYVNGSTGMGIDFNAMLPITAQAGTGAITTGDFGLHPQCADQPSLSGQAPTPGLKTLFDQNKLAFVANVGTLVQPITKTEYEAGVVPRPPRVGSHSDQQNLWAVGRSDPTWQQGWGGMLSARLTPSGSDNDLLPPSFSLSGHNLFQVGTRLADSEAILPYKLSASSAVEIANYNGSSTLQTARRAALNDLLEQSYPETFTNEYGKILNRANRLATTVNDLIDQGAGSTAAGDGWGRINTPYQSSGNFDPVNNRYPTPQLTIGNNTYDNGLLSQLRMVARLIKASRHPDAGVNAERQIYFVRLSGFDTHFDQMQEKTQPLLMARFSQAVGYFSQAMEEIGAEDDVTLFSTSEFARTLSPNGSGTDHAWGGVQFVMGGAVNGGQIYGKYPNLEIGANNDAESDWSFSRGQYIPTTSVEQMMATLASWMGADNNQLETIFPNLVNFNQSNLGFMKS